MSSILFITGTDTGVGKTVLTALLTRFLRQRQCDALAMKPFCSGAPDDVELLWQAQDQAIAKNDINPFYFKQAAAPLIGARADGRRIGLAEALRKIRALAARCELLLVEGAGGLYAPLGEGYTVASLIERLRCPVVVVARNQLGTVNHTLLTVNALRALGVRKMQIVLMGTPHRDLASRTNARLIAEFARQPVICIPHLALQGNVSTWMSRHEKKLKKALAQILGIDIFSTSSRERGKSRAARAERKLQKSSCNSERKR